MTVRRRITARDGHVLEVARADPVRAPTGGVIVLHAIYGLTAHIESVCDRRAEAGYTAVAPALYDRIGPGLTCGYDKAGAEKGRGAYARLDEAVILADVSACIREVAGSGPVVISGFCTGGSFAWVAAAKLDGLAAQVNWYGSHVASRHLDLRPRCPTIIHYGDADHVVPLADVARIRADHPSVELHVHPGAGHAFLNPEQDHFDAVAATQSWRRSLDFLARVLPGRS
jgi:carboxymethylenebutenolidase